MESQQLCFTVFIACTIVFRAIVIPYYSQKAFKRSDPDFGCIHLRWDLVKQVCGIKKAIVSLEIEDFTINIKTTTFVLMELSRQGRVGNVYFNLFSHFIQSWIFDV